MHAAAELSTDLRQSLTSVTSNKCKAGCVYCVMQGPAFYSIANNIYTSAIDLMALNESCSTQNDQRLRLLFVYEHEQSSGFCTLLILVIAGGSLVQIRSVEPFMSSELLDIEWTKSSDGQHKWSNVVHN
jgi:hypothetical protein